MRARLAWLDWAEMTSSLLMRAACEAGDQRLRLRVLIIRTRLIARMKDIFIIVLLKV
jgi:hypothetical protein